MIRNRLTRPAGATYVLGCAVLAVLTLPEVDCGGCFGLRYGATLPLSFVTLGALFIPMVLLPDEGVVTGAFWTIAWAATGLANAALWGGLGRWIGRRFR